MAIRDGGGGVTISGNTIVGNSYWALSGISIGPEWIAPTVADSTVYGFGIGYAIAQHNCVTTLTASISGSREPLEGPPVKAKSTSSGNVLVLS